MTDDFIQENYTFTKDVLINNDIDSSTSIDFYNKNNLPEVLRCCLEFLHASGYTYVERLIAVNSDGKEMASDDDIDEEVLNILTDLVDQIETTKKARKKPKLEVVVSNDNDSNTGNDSS